MKTSNTKQINQAVIFATLQTNSVLLIVSPCESLRVPRKLATNMAFIIEILWCKVWCKVRLDEFVLVIGAVYRTPGSSLQVIEDVYDYIQYYNLASSKLVLLGDFN